MITAMRQVWGEGLTREWLEGMMANAPRSYEDNTSIVAAVGAREVEVGLTNHYYLYRFLAAEGLGFAARNYALPAGGPGSLVMVSGAGILDASNRKDVAAAFLRFMLDRDAQEYFAVNTFEYPLVDDVPLLLDLTPLSELDRVPVELADLNDLEGTVALLQSVGALP